MTFYKWAGKLLTRQGKLAVAQTCCCDQWYCVLTAAGNYECRDKRPDPNENAQVLTEHKTSKDCQAQCYERYYCIDVSGDYQCVKEKDLPPNATIISGPQRREECEAKCENCPPCGNEACEAATKGDNTIIEDCCFNLADEEQWTFNGTDWELTQHCGKDPRTPCKGRPVPSFPVGINVGDVFTLSCVPDGRKPDDNRDCEKCLYDCDKTSAPYACIPAPDTGKYTEKECKPECEGLWYCKSTTECERQNPPINPAKPGYETEGDCVLAAASDCAPPPPADCYFCNASSPTNIVNDPKPPADCVDQGGFLSLAAVEDRCNPPPANCSECSLESFTLSIDYPAIEGTACNGFSVTGTAPKIGGPEPANGADGVLSMRLDNGSTLDAIIDIQQCDGAALFRISINMFFNCRGVVGSDSSTFFVQCGRKTGFNFFRAGATGTILPNRVKPNPLP